MSSKVIGICGRQGSGKTTAASYLVTKPKVSLKRYTNPWAYILHCLFGWDLEKLSQQVPKVRSRVILMETMKRHKLEYPRDPIWDLYPSEALEYTLDALDHVFPDGVTQAVTFNFRAPVLNAKGDKVEISLADPLKQMCTVFGFQYDILLGVSANTRKIRETQKRDFGSIKLTGRQLLENVGTNGFRNHFDQDFWVKIAEREISKHKFVVIPDIRFHNELDLLKRLKGKLWVVHRHPRELILTDDDQKQHPAKWTFLTFIDDSISQYIPNTGTLDEFKKTVHNRFIEFMSY